MELNANTQTEQPIQEEVHELLNELKNNNLNGNEIIAVLKAENAELRLGFENVRDQLLDMLTRGDNDRATQES